MKYSMMVASVHEGSDTFEKKHCVSASLVCHSFLVSLSLSAWSSYDYVDF